MKKSFSILLILSLLIILSPYLKAHAQENDSMEKISSVHNYIEYLNEKNEHDESTNDILDQFLELSKEDQELFIQALQPENYIKINSLALGRPNESIEVELDNGKKIDVQVNFNTQQEVNKIELLSLNSIQNTQEDNKFKRQSLYSNLNISRLTTYRVTTPWASAQLALLGITTSTFSTRMILETDGSQALQVYDIERKYVNHNPAIWTTDIGYTNFYISGGKGYGGYQWKLSATGALGSISSNLDMIIRADHNTRHFRVNSGRSSWNQNWTAF